MNFELNDYHRNISEKELIDDVVLVAKLLKKNTLTMKEYNSHGRFYSSTYLRKFGSWKNTLIMCGLDISGHSFAVDCTTANVIEDILAIKEKLNAETITREQYDTYGKYSSSTLEHKFGSWNNVLKMSNLPLNVNRNITNENLFCGIERLWTVLGRQPTTTDIKKGTSVYSLNTYTRRFGGWRNTLNAFVNYINKSDDSNNSSAFLKNNDCSEFPMTTTEDTLDDKHKTSREVNLRLRFKVMQRDNFKCCICGASPATNPSIELHIDHIVPWSKGGETLLKNLQTLCSNCNYGKSNL